MAMASIFCCGCGVGRDGIGMMSTQSESMSRSAPWLMLTPAAGAYRFYSLAEEKVLSFEIEKGGGKAPDMDARVVGSSHGWLALQKNRQLFLSNPLSRRHIKLPTLKSKSVSKVVISCSPEREECRAVVCGGGGTAFCLPGRSREWTPLGLGGVEEKKLNDGNYNYDVAYSSRREVFTCSSGTFPALDVEDWDLRDPLSPKIDYEMDWNRMKAMMKQRERNWIMGRGRLIRHPIHVGEDLYFIYRFVVGKRDFTGDFIVFKVDQSQLKRVETLHSLAVFVGINHAFAIPDAQLVPPLNPNSVYMKDHMCVFSREYTLSHPPSHTRYHRYATFASCWFTPT